MGVGVLTAYADFLPVTPDTPLISMGEGRYAAGKVPQAGRGHRLRRAVLQAGGCNPTGSFKDRGMVVAMAKALEGAAKR